MRKFEEEIEALNQETFHSIFRKTQEQEEIYRSMEPKIDSLSENHRDAYQQLAGPPLKLLFTVVGKERDLELTEPIIVNKRQTVVMVRFKFQYVQRSSFTLNSSIILKKMDKSNSATVHVRCEQLYKWWNCTDDWTEYELPSKVRDSVNKNIISCNLEVNITVHESSIPVLMKSLKLYEDTEFTDFQLRAADGAVAVHKCVMAIHSDMFKKMMTGEWKETTEGCINLAGLTVRSLQHLKDYMYLGTLPLPYETDALKMLLLVADCYMIEHLKAGCIRELVERVKSANVDKLVEFACQNNIPDLVRALLYQFPHRIQNGFYEEAEISKKI